MNIYPYPYKVKISKDRGFKFGTSINAYVESTSQNKIFVELWKNFTFGAGELKLIEKKDLKHQMVIGNISAPCLDDGFDYALEANDEGIAITGGDNKGLIHGFMSLLQLISPICLEKGNEAFMIKAAKILDKPHLKFRGVHLCVFLETELEFIRKVIRLCGMLKYSHVVIEFWGSLKLDTMKELAWENAYTKNQLGPIIEDARSFGIEIIPMFNHLGHAALARCRYGKHVVLDQDPSKAMLFGSDGWTWNIKNPKTIRLLKSVRSELIEIFREGEYFHIGCDEAHTFEDTMDSEERNQLLLEYLNDLAEDLAKENRRAIMWGDMLLEHDRWKNYTASSYSEYKILDKLDKSIVIADWQYDNTEGNIETTEHFIKNGFDVLSSPWNNYSNVKVMINTVKAHEGFGALQTTWDNLAEDIIVLPYSGTEMWRDGVQTNASLGTIRIKAADMIRKLMPAGGSYEKAGWKKRDFEIIV